MLQHDLDVVLHLGDYTYEYAIDGNNRGVELDPSSEARCEDLHTYGSGTRSTSSIRISRRRTASSRFW